MPACARRWFRKYKSVPQTSDLYMRGPTSKGREGRGRKEEGERGEKKEGTRGQVPDILA